MASGYNDAAADSWNGALRRESRSRLFGWICNVGAGCVVSRESSVSESGGKFRIFGVAQQEVGNGLLPNGFILKSVDPWERVVNQDRDYSK